MHIRDMQSETNEGGGKKYAFNVSFLITLMKQETASFLQLESNGNISSLNVRETYPHQPGMYFCQMSFKLVTKIASLLLLPGVTY